MKNVFLWSIIFTLSTTLLILSCSSDHEEPIIAESNTEEILKFRSDEFDCASIYLADLACPNGFLIDTLSYEYEVYPGCDVLVEWVELVCDQSEPGLPIIRVAFLDVTGWPVTGGCDSIYNLWNQYEDKGLWDEYGESVMQLQRDVETYLEQARIQDFIDLGVFDCDRNNGNLVSEFYKSTCQFTDFYSCGKFPLIPVIGSCGKSCCKRTTKWCADENGIAVPDGVSIETIGNCEGDRIPGPSPGRKCEKRLSGKCFDTCEE